MLIDYSLVFINMEEVLVCVLSPLLYSLFTNNCTAVHDSNTIINFADEMMVVGRITNEDEADCELQEMEGQAQPNPHRWDCSGQGRELQVPQCPHH